MSDCYVEPRLINAYELAEKVWSSKDHNPHEDLKIARNHRLEHEHFLRLIAEAPTINPMKQGKWEQEFDTYGEMRCSVCKGPCPLLQVPIDGWREELHFILDSSYCPWCGAKMDGGAET